MTIPEKLQQTSDELGSVAQDLLIPFLSRENITIKQRNFVVIQTTNASSNSFIFGHDTNGVLGTATGLGGSQIVLGDTTGSTDVEIVRRRYDWDKSDEFEKGQKSDNMDISQGFLQLGNVIVKDISIEHKENKNN